MPWVLWTMPGFEKFRAMLQKSFYLFLIVGTILFVSVLHDFWTRLGAPLPHGGLPDVAVVFTGQFDRIELALALFDNQRINQLFISGVNPLAGIDLDNFAAQFAVSSAVISALAVGEIMLGPDANSTFENAVETACWLAQSQEIGAVILITGRYHMPRASLTLERAVPSQLEIIRVSPDGPGGALSGVARSEFTKFLATWVLTLMPKSFWPGAISISC